MHEWALAEAVIKTASEIAQLRLSADWVVLSACNTAVGDRPGAEPGRFQSTAV